MPQGYMFILAVFCLAGLSVDYSSNKVYWINSGNGTINRCNLDGSGLEVIDSLKKELMKATALAVMGKVQEYSSIVCSDWLKASSFQCETSMFFFF